MTEAVPAAGTVAAVSGVPEAVQSGETASAQGQEETGLPPYLRRYEIVHLQFADETHEYLRESIQLADQKAGAIAAGATALLAYLFRGGAADVWMLPARPSGIGDVIGLIAVAGLALSVIGALAVIVPRLTGAPRGPVYWKSIAQFDSATSYTGMIRSLDDTGLVDARLQHCFELARVCTRKYRALNRAIWAGAVGLVAAVTYLMALGGTPA
ncbi:MAG: DUF5706 domain-containing protein [Gemmatimonadetes bacterium]|nr:DUF5706 domain-containing protein [Gemmatimonadota bacterium]